MYKISLAAGKSSCYNTFEPSACRVQGRQGKWGWCWDRGCPGAVALRRDNSIISMEDALFRQGILSFVTFPFGRTRPGTLSVILRHEVQGCPVQVSPVGAQYTPYRVGLQTSGGAQEARTGVPELRRSSRQLASRRGPDAPQFARPRREQEAPTHQQLPGDTRSTVTHVCYSLTPRWAGY